MKIKFTQGTAGIGFGYHVGETIDVSEAEAMEFVNLGYAEIITTAPDALPADIPGRDFLLKAGFKTLDEVKAVISGLTEIEGIGAATAVKIAEYLNK